MHAVLLSGGYMSWLMLLAFLVLTAGGVFLCRWIYNKMIHTRWDKNDITDIKD